MDTVQHKRRRRPDKKDCWEQNLQAAAECEGHEPISGGQEPQKPPHHIRAAEPSAWNEEPCRQHEDCQASSEDQPLPRTIPRERTAASSEQESKDQYSDPPVRNTQEIDQEEIPASVPVESRRLCHYEYRCGKEEAAHDHGSEVVHQAAAAGHRRSGQAEKGIRATWPATLGGSSTGGWDQHQNPGFPEPLPRAIGHRRPRRQPR